ncbi:response regulator [Lentzea sp. NPDC059081]|uniref:response regulator n=1 Tax=Lentzea sp. NPDC059081 TaxID=3346719 RepID=UPI0036CDB6FA
MRQAGLVLVVEDDDSVRKYTAASLKRLGHEVLQASGGAEAIAILRSRAETISVVLLDQTMPGLSGEDVLDEMASAGVAVPVVLTSGHDRKSMQRRLAGRSVAGFLQKPFRLKTLEETISAVMEQSAQTS